MHNTISRRSFLATTGTAAAAASLAPTSWIHAAETAVSPPPFPLVDLHVHLDNSTIDKVAALGRERGVKFGIVEHAGTKENKYPVVLSNDDEFRAYIKMLDGQGVYKGVQAEWTDWMRCFSRPVLAQLDYTLTDTMTFPGKDGQRVKLWEPSVEDRVDMADRQKWMDRYVAWHLDIITQQPIDILANTSWLPAPLADRYEEFWTPARMKKVLDAAREYRVAIEISASFKLPKLSFLKAAQTAGLKFVLGSNGRYPNMGKLDYSLEMAKALKLTAADLFTPAPDGDKAVQRRKY